MRMNHENQYETFTRVCKCVYECLDTFAGEVVAEVCNAHHVMTPRESLIYNAVRGYSAETP